MSKKCYSFEPTGHRYLPLDGFYAEGGTLVSRLYCPSCGRVIPASFENNQPSWKIETPSDNWTDAPTIVRKSDA